MKKINLHDFIRLISIAVADNQYDITNSVYNYMNDFVNIIIQKYIEHTMNFGNIFNIKRYDNRVLESISTIFIPSSISDMMKENASKSLGRVVTLSKLCNKNVDNNEIEINEEDTDTYKDKNIRSKQDIQKCSDLLLNIGIIGDYVSEFLNTSYKYNVYLTGLLDHLIAEFFACMMKYVDSKDKYNITVYDVKKAIHNDEDFHKIFTNCGIVVL